MIDISHWRVCIGLWACHQISYCTCAKKTPSTETSIWINGVTIIRKNKDLTFSLGVLLSLLLILSGDVELNPGPKADITNILKATPDEDQLFDLLYNIRDKWNEIGLALHVHHNILADLKHLNYSDTFRLLNVINICITQPSPITWEMVITAMENPIVNNKEKSDLICHYLSADITSILKETPDEDELVCQLLGIEDKWYRIGKSLQLDCNDLDHIKHSQDDNIAKLRKVLKISLHVTWEKVITAIKGPIVKNEKKAMEICHHLKLVTIRRLQYNPSPDTEISNSDELLDKAMKEGYVVARWTRFSVSGAPGTGKSSFLRLLYNEDPPVHHDSTSVVVPQEARRISISRAIIDDDTTWTKINYENIKEMIAQGIKDGVRPSKRFKLQTINEESDEVMKNADGDDSKPITTTAKISQEIVSLLPHVEKSELLYKSHWIYGVDTGGQAAFLDIAPALLRYNSVNIFTHKLTERLGDKAKFFFSVKGRPIGEPDEKQMTNLQLLEASVCSLSLADSPVLPNIHVKLVQGTSCLILGTFLDKMLESSESLNKKNELLWSHLNKFSKIIIKTRPAGEEVIFSVNNTARGPSELNMARKIRDKICQCYIEAEIPIRWFLLQLELEQLHKSSKSGIVTKSKCFEIGQSLRIDVKEIEAALMYYHDLTIFLYFPQILPDVVFLHPQPLLDKLSNLISISIDNAVNHLDDEGISLPLGTYEELKYEGTFKEDLLTSPNSHLSQGFSPEFKPKDFFKLMTSLYIMAALPEKGKYFLPTVLPIKPSTEYKSIPSPFKEHVDPLILSWDMKPLPRGVFPALVVNLLHRKNQPRFQLKRPLRSTQRYRNIITLQTNYGDVLLVDGIYWIAIYYSGFPTECCILRDIIYTGINEVTCKFQYMANVKSVNEYFYCTIPDCPKKASEHFCRLSDDKLKCICQDSSQTTDTDETRQLPWFRASYPSRQDSASVGHKRPNSMEEMPLSKKKSTTSLTTTLSPHDFYDTSQDLKPVGYVPRKRPNQFPEEAAPSKRECTTLSKENKPAHDSVTQSGQQNLSGAAVESSGVIQQGEKNYYHATHFTCAVQ